MSNAASIGGDLYGLLVRHPWRPGGYVVGCGTTGSVKVVTEQGEIARMTSDTLVGLRALAVNPKLMTWGSEETTLGVGVGGSVSVVRVAASSAARQSTNVLRVDDALYVCSSLQWSPDTPTYLAASFQPQHDQTHPLKKCVKVFDLSAPSILSPHIELPSECAYCVCWLSAHSLLASIGEGLSVCDLRQREQNRVSVDRSPLYHMTLCPNDANIVAGVRVTSRGHTLELHDLRRIEKGPVVRAQSKLSIGSLAWHNTNGKIVTAGVGNSVVETWDTALMLRDTASARDAGYESDYDCRTARDGGDNYLERRTSKKGLVSTTKGHEERRVGQAVVASCWASDEAVDTQLMILTDRGEVVPHCGQQQARMAVAPCGVIAQASADAVPQVLHTPDYTDIATAMRVREEKGIGTSRHASYRVAKECNDVPLQQWAYWTWIMRRAEEHTKGKVTFPSFHDVVKSPGDITARLLAETEQEKKERPSAEPDTSAKGSPSHDTGGCKGHHAVLERQFKLHDTEWRRFLQTLCGWVEAPDMPAGVEVPIMYSVSKAADFERSVANKLLHLRLTEAEDMLRHADAPTYNLLAFALSGLTIESSVTWSETVGALASSVLTPYLTTALLFLSSWSKTVDEEETPWARYADVLECTAIDVLYRLGFACRYLGDEALSSYVSHVLATHTLHPVVKLLLSGVSEAVLSEFLDRTGDIQVTALTAVMFLSYQADSTQRWVKNYREFLQVGGSEFARCRVEGLFSNFVSAKTQAQPATVQPKVPYPGGLRMPGMDPRKMLRLQKQLSHQMRQAKPADRSASKEEKKQAQAPYMQLICKCCNAVLSVGSKPSVCLKCNNPLPKCAVCVKTLGLDQEATAHQITWCLSCGHGGHVNHLLDWFDEHTACPVAGCECTCASLD